MVVRLTRSILLLAVLLAARLEAAGTPTKGWTVLLYFAGDNNLEQGIVHDALAAEWRGTRSNVNIALQLDRGRTASAASGGWTGSRRYLLRRSWDEEHLVSPVAKDLGRVNMACGDTLVDFLTWGIRRLPAEHYLLVISSHGEGWEGAIEDLDHPEGACGESWMNLAGLEHALARAQSATGITLDVLGFDACLMGQIEVAWELRRRARFLVASEELIGSAGWPYERILFQSFFRARPPASDAPGTPSPRELAVRLVEATRRAPEGVCALAAIDLSRLEPVAGAVRALASGIAASPLPGRAFVPFIDRAQPFDRYGVRDLYDFAARLAGSAEMTDAAVREAARAVTTALAGCIEAETHLPHLPGAHGLATNLVFNFDEPSMKYRARSQWARDTGWDRALAKMQH